MQGKEGPRPLFLEACGPGERNDDDPSGAGAAPEDQETPFIVGSGVLNCVFRCCVCLCSEWHHQMFWLLGSERDVFQAGHALAGYSGLLIKPAGHRAGRSPGACWSETMSTQNVTSKQRFISSTFAWQRRERADLYPARFRQSTRNAPTLALPALDGV